MTTRGMRALKALFDSWLDFSEILWGLGLILVVVIIGAAIYAQWIRPEETTNDIVNDLLGRLPNWTWYAVLAIGLPVVLLFAVHLFMPATWVMMLLVGLVQFVAWLTRRLRVIIGRLFLVS